jgi:hypothetical protein
MAFVLTVAAAVVDIVVGAGTAVEEGQVMEFFHMAEAGVGIVGLTKAVTARVAAGQVEQETADVDTTGMVAANGFEAEVTGIGRAVRYNPVLDYGLAIARVHHAAEIAGPAAIAVADCCTARRRGSSRWKR